MKKKRVIYGAILVLFLGVYNESYAIDTSLAGYLTYWNGKKHGSGGGIKLKKEFLAFLSADVRASYIDFQKIDTSAVPLEATLMFEIPLFLNPYVGMGASYYFFDSSRPEIRNGSGLYGVFGLQFNFWKMGAMAEVRYNTAEPDLMEGMSANIGLLFRWD